MDSRNLFGQALRSLAVNLSVGIGFGSVFFSAGGERTFAGWLVAVCISTAYANFIGLPSTLLFALLWPRVRKLRPLAHALACIGALLPVAALGCAAADAFFVAMRLRPASDFSARLATDLRVALVIGVMVGVAVIGFERLRGRLEDTQAKLRDEELLRERALRLAADARLASLESRIRPHFLFNSLNAVLALIPQDPKRAETVLERLTAVLRSSLRFDACGVVLLRDELALVRDYLEIERIRFDVRLRYAIDVPSSLAETGVPAFAVQTLVENSVKHAVAARREGAEVRVTASRCGASVFVEVRDDGPGFGTASPPEGHGLHTLRGRLAALFGETGSLEVGSGGVGARVVLRIPAGTAGEAAE